MTTIDDVQLIEIPKVHDVRGNLSVIEGSIIPFEFKRVYYLYDVPTGAERGGHSHNEQQEILLALSGSFDVILNDGMTTRTVSLNKPNFGLLIPFGIVLYRLLSANAGNIYVYIFLVLFVFWLLYRLLKGVSVIFDVNPGGIYFYGLVSIFALLVIYFLYYEVNNSVMQYLKFALKQFNIFG